MDWPLRKEELSMIDFAKALLVTQDLDPVYFGLLAIKNKAQLKRWLVAYWCFYHCGFACYASEREGRKFWQVLHTAAENTEPCPAGGRWPRSAERRHFRGDAAITCVNRLNVRYNKPEDFVDYVAQGRTLEEVAKLVKEHYLFGGWVSFKIADMLERCLQRKIAFSEDVLMYKEPQAGALLAYQESHPGEIPMSLRAATLQITSELSQALIKFKAPPHFDRLLAIQELETVYCRFKSYRKGSYYVGKDTKEIRHGIQPWLTVSPTAKKFLQEFPK